MKLMRKSLALFALSGLAGSTFAAPVLINNGDFSTAGGAGFGQFTSDGTVIDFPTTGGNGGGYARIDNSVGDWGGGLVSPPDGDPTNGTPLGDLGLVAGETYTFSMDMITFSGGGNGAIKLESWNESGFINTPGDMAASGSSGSWATYSWDYTIDPGATRIKIVPLLTVATGGGNSVIGYDNITVDNTPVPPPPFVPDQIPNGGFEDPAGADWSSSPTATFPASGGNPAGYAVLDDTTVDFSVIYSFDGAEKTFASLGFAPGDTMTIQFDMLLVSGTNIGGIRLQGPAGYVDEIYPTIINGGATWETYTVDVVVPATPMQASIGLRPGGGSVVAFDNVSIGIPVVEPFVATIDQGTIVSWTAASMTNIYQPQESEDGIDWMDLGSPIVGDAVTSVFDPNGSPNYRVQESVVTVQDDVLNGSFETGQAVDPLCPEFWECLDVLSGEDLWLPTLITTDFRTGFQSLRLKVQNSDTSFPNKAEIIQNILNQGGSITPGNTYDFSFWAKDIITGGVSYVQQYQFQWLDADSLAVGTGIPSTQFTGGNGEWAKVGVTGLVAPPTAVTALIQISCETGAVAGATAEGEVLIDDVSLVTSTTGSTSTIAASTAPGVGISFPTEAGETYQVKSSMDAISFPDFGGPIIGDGEIFTATDTVADGMLYRVVEGN